jgi:2,5-diamino-6-(ribosylamino)-4(3H)-pyrimidinone 5'-phosphate reductase
MGDERPSLDFPASSQSLFQSYLPHHGSQRSDSPGTRPFVTLTYAQSLDGAIALSPGTQTVLSGQETKAMTHYLRSIHDAILIGAGTAIADDPSLNCRLTGITLATQPRPVIVDPDRRWNVSKSQCWKLAKNKLGQEPWIIVDHIDVADVEEHISPNGNMWANDGAWYSRIPRADVHTQHGAVREIPWQAIFETLGREGYQSVMVEGGAGVINSLLRPDNLHLVNSVIVTIAPTWLGQGSVNVRPERRQDDSGAIRPTLRLRNTKWHQFGEVVVMCGRVDPNSLPQVVP